MTFRKIITLLTLITLHAAFFKYSSNLLSQSELNYYLNVVKSAFHNKSVEVSVTDIQIQQSISNPNKFIITLLISEKNKGDSNVSPADYSLSTSDGLSGVREIFNNSTWKPLAIGSLAPGQQKEGAVFFEIPKSDNYTFTYNRGYQTTHYKISSEKGLFVPFVINPL